MARKDWAKYWNGDTDGTTAANEEATTSFIVPASDNWVMPGPESTQLSGVRAQVTTPDGTINKLYFVGSAGSQTGWSRGLPILVDTVSGGVPQRRTATTWTQDDTSVSYPLNPRVLETNIYDAVGNPPAPRSVTSNLPSATPLVVGCRATYSNTRLTRRRSCAPHVLTTTAVPPTPIGAFLACLVKGSFTKEP